MKQQSTCLYRADGAGLTDMCRDALLFLDGAMGTQLQSKGLQPGDVPELWNLTRPGDVRAVHEAYFAAGADVVYSNTFGANSAKSHGDAPLADVVAAGVGLAKEAAANAGGRRLVALDVDGRNVVPVVKGLLHDEGLLGLRLSFHNI